MDPTSKRSSVSAAWPRPSPRAFRNLRIEEAAARAQARIDSGRQTIVGVNKFRQSSEAEIAILRVDNKAVRDQQLAKLSQLKSDRDEATVIRAALAALTDGAPRGKIC